MKIVKTRKRGRERRSEKKVLKKKRSKVGQSPVTSTQNPYESAKKKKRKKTSVKTLIVVKWKKKS